MYPPIYMWLVVAVAGILGVVHLGVSGHSIMSVALFVLIMFMLFFDGLPMLWRAF